MVGADPVKLNGSNVSKATVANPEVVRVNQAALESYQLYRGGLEGPWGPGAHVAWVAQLPGNVSALALFNIGDAEATVGVDLAPGSKCSVRDLWARQENGTAIGSYACTLAPHSAALVTLSGCPLPVPPTSSIQV